MIGRSNNMDK